MRASSALSRSGAIDRFAVLPYGIAVVCSAAAIGVSVGLETHVDAEVPLLLGVMATAWFAGFRAALLALGLVGAVLVYYDFTPPIHSPAFELERFVRLMLFTVVAVPVAAVTAGRRRAEERALQERVDLLNLTHDTIFVRDRRDVITFWNRGAEELYGWTSAEALGRTTHDLLQTVFPMSLKEITVALTRDGRWEGELVHTRRDGSKVVVASRWALQRNDRGESVAILETNNDITERKRAEAELRESERRHRHIFHSVGVSIWEEDFSRVLGAIDDLKAQGIQDVRGYLETHREFVGNVLAMIRIVDVNEFTVRLFGAASKEQILGSLPMVFAPETYEVFIEELVAIAERRPSFESETVLRTLQGDELAVLFTITFPPPPSRLESVLVNITDITERKRAEKALDDLAGRLIHAQEAERSRIGRELHDHIGQLLGVLAIQIDQLRASPEITPTTAGALAELRRGASEVTQDVHQLSHRLHSSTLDYLGLVPALQKLVDDFAARVGIATEFVPVSLSSPFPSDVALCLFRVTEESLTNIAKHSQARSVRVRMTAAADGLSLTIDDDGVGLDVKRLSSRAGLGFVSMQERLRLLRGTIRVDSAPSRGTSIKAWVPAESLPQSVTTSFAVRGGGAP